MEAQFDHVDNPLTTQNNIYHTDTAPGPPPPTTPAVRQASPPPPTTDKALLLQWLQDLSEQVRQLQHSTHPTCQPHHTQVRHQPPPFTPTRQHWAPPISVTQGLVQVPPGALCYYHQRFGHLARNCQPPCTWRAAQAVGKLVGRRREAHTTAPAAASPQLNYTTTTTQPPHRAPTDANPAPTMRHKSTHTTTTPLTMPPPPASSPNDRTLLWLEDMISGETFLVDSGSEASLSLPNGSGVPFLPSPMSPARPILTLYWRSTLTSSTHRPPPPSATRALHGVGVYYSISYPRRLALMLSMANVANSYKSKVVMKTHTHTHTHTSSSHWHLITD
ncbi:hypothetical protein Pmani_000413 [Petrolisthes manimaculis]|uniref:Uncharacterized protein n=1 Tax=Petrolisthes manimaculis TaxID=1843537 RepID=A0AAE1QLP1_9EUCA|nr:hypothetical protein Pmani_000413 [Petrolisthes manimaculis]